MKNIPNRIYLQIGLKENGESCNDFKELSNVSWCSDKIYEDDLEFISVKHLKESTNSLKLDLADGVSEFKKYRRTQVAEMRPVTEYDVEVYFNHAGELIVMNEKKVVKVSISVEDLANGSPKIGDMIARNPKNHNDQWLVAEQYFKDNFEPL